MVLFLRSKNRFCYIPENDSEQYILGWNKSKSPSIIYPKLVNMWYKMPVRSQLIMLAIQFILIKKYTLCPLWIFIPSFLSLFLFNFLVFTEFLHAGIFLEIILLSSKTLCAPDPGSMCLLSVHISPCSWDKLFNLV